MHYSDPSFAGLIGAAMGDITPPVGIYNRNWGAAVGDIATGIDRPLTVTALVLQTARKEPPHVIVGLDLGWWRDYSDERYVREAVIAECGLEYDRVLINLSHSHASPSTCRADSDKPGGNLVAPYLDYIRSQSVAIVRQAMEHVQPAILAWTYGKCDLAQNRDLPDPDRNRLVCGWNPSGKPDDTLLVGSVTAESGEILATVVNYACHPVTLAWDNDLISPDYVGAMRETIQRDTGGAPCLFLQGASGELAPREEYVGDTAIADANGRKVGHAVLSTLATMLPPATMLDYGGIVESGAPLAVWNRKPFTPAFNLSSKRLDIELPLKPTESLQEIESQLEQCADRVQSERLWRKLNIKRNVGDGDSAIVPIWVWRIGDMNLVAQQNEAYSTLQSALRAANPGRAIAVLNLTNGGCGYLPPRSYYERDIYQVWQTPFAAGSVEAIIEAAKAAIAG